MILKLSPKRHIANSVRMDDDVESSFGDTLESLYQAAFFLVIRGRVKGNVPISPLKFFQT